MGCVLEELLSSFTEVKKCSQEGREQMGMDTNAIYNYATSLCDIQPADDAKDLKYVMDYLTCCKLEQPADVLAWAEKHKDDYSLEVVNSILNYAMAKKLSKQDLKDLKESIDPICTPRRSRGGGRAARGGGTGSVNCLVQTLHLQHFFSLVGFGASMGVILTGTTGARMRGRRRAMVSKMRSMFSFVLAYALSPPV